MRSHMHELWEDLELSPLYPEPDLDQVTDRVMEQITQETPAHGGGKRRRPMHKKKLLLSLAAALVVLTGSAVAVGSQMGLLDLLFKGDTSGLEPYVQTEVGSAENEDYRFTVNSVYYDGMTAYATVTVEGLNDQAVEDLKSNKVIAECHREDWGQEMVDGLMKSGRTGPDTFRSNANEWIMKVAKPDLNSDNAVSMGGIGSGDLPDPSDTSRAWRVSIHFDYWIGEQDGALELWTGFMGRDYAVEIPLDHIAGSIHLTPNTEVLLNPITGQRATITEIGITPTQIYFSGEWDERIVSETYAQKSVEAWCAVRLKDGTIFTSSQMGRRDGSSSGLNGFASYGDIETVPTSDISQVASIIIGDMEFPADGSDPIPVDPDLHLSPFELTYPMAPPYHERNSPDYTEADQKIMEQSRRSLISFRLLCENLGAEYTWDEETQTAVASYRDVTIQVPVGSTQITVNGQTVNLTYSHYDENGEETKLPNSTEPSELEDDVLVNISSLADAWEVDIYWSRTTENGVTTDKGWVISP